MNEWMNWRIKISVVALPTSFIYFKLKRRSKSSLVNHPTPRPNIFWLGWVSQGGRENIPESCSKEDQFSYSISLDRLLILRFFPPFPSFSQNPTQILRNGMEWRVAKVVVKAPYFSLSLSLLCSSFLYWIKCCCYSVSFLEHVHFPRIPILHPQTNLEQARLNLLCGKQEEWNGMGMKVAERVSANPGESHTMQFVARVIAAKEKREQGAGQKVPYRITTPHHHLGMYLVFQIPIYYRLEPEAGKMNGIEKWK